MFSIIEHIEYLMMSHDCVAVPNWGAFIANYSTARYDEGRHIMQRPRRTIGFNASVSHNDGLLAQSLMRREGMSYVQAMAFIMDSVTTWRQQLAMGGEVSMGRLGYLRRSSGKYLEFVPFCPVHAIDQFFGLENLAIKPVAVLEREQAEREAAAALAEQAKREAIVPAGRHLFSRKAGQIAASIAVLIGLSIALTTPVIVDHNQHNTASMAPAVTAPKAQQIAPAAAPKPTIASVGNTSGQYRMVIATVRNQAEMHKFKRSYPELVPYMKTLKHNKFTCIYVASSDDFDTLMGLVDQLPEPLRHVWIYK